MTAPTHWADKAEIQRAGLLPGDGDAVDNQHTCFVGGWLDPATNEQVDLRHSGPEHIIVHATDRWDRGASLIVPTLLSWRGSAVMYDIKGGMSYAQTAGWRESVGQRVLRFSPTDAERSCHFNPLAEVRVGTAHEMSDVQIIASTIVDPDGKGINDRWRKTGLLVITAAILHVLYSPDFKLKTLSALVSLLSSPGIDPEIGVDQIFAMMGCEHDPEGKLGWTDDGGKPTRTHPAITRLGREMAGQADDVKLGVISALISFMAIYCDPQVAETTARSDFSITDLVNADQPASLYIVAPPYEADRLKPLFRLIMSQIVWRLTDQTEGCGVTKPKHQLLLMVDDFPTLGRLAVLEDLMDSLADHGIKAYLTCHGINQLRRAYTQDESITSSCHVRIYAAPWPWGAEAARLSDELGRGLLTSDDVSRLLWSGSDETGVSVTPGEMMIITSPDHAPVLGSQVLYHMNPIFSRHALMTAPDVGDTAHVWLKA